MKNKISLLSNAIMICIIILLSGLLTKTEKVIDIKVDNTQIIGPIMEIPIEEPEVVEEPKEKTYGKLTHYGPDCVGCSGITASGYDVRNTIYYNDKEYGKVRIIAMSKKYPFYSIIRLSNYKQGEIIAIVLDRGGNIKGDRIDLLVENEKKSYQLGVQRDVEIEVLREGK